MKIWLQVCRLGISALFCLALVCPAAAQRVPRQSQNVPSLGSRQLDFSGTIDVIVVPIPGSTLAVHPDVTIYSEGLDSPSIRMPSQVRENEWIFQGLEVGRQYTIRVTARGFQPEQEYVILPSTANASARVRIHLRSVEPRSKSGLAPGGEFLLAPALQRKVQQALKYLKEGKNAEAQKELKKVVQMVPGHPGVNYLLGLSYLRGNQASQAIPYLEKSISIDPRQLHARLALGIAYFDQHDFAGAVRILGELLEQEPSFWQAHWVIASTYLREKNYEQARQHAELALQYGEKQARGARLELGEAYAGLGRREQAIQTLQDFLRENHRGPQAEQARAMIRKLRRPPPAPRAAPERPTVASNHPLASAPALEEEAALASMPVAQTVSLRAGSRLELSEALLNRKSSVLLPKENWAPPGVDSVQPATVPGVACHLPAILRQARRQAIAWVKELQEFSATEEYQSAEINRRGEVARPFRQEFRYLVFVKKLRPHLFTLEELRQPAPDPRRMGAPIFGLGMSGLALVFHPDFQRDFAWSCEGLGHWEGQPAWVVRFEQLPDRPTASLMSFETPTDSQLLPLKGLVWLSRKDSHVMHLETDLVKPLKSVRLEREHFSVDYRLVRFRSHPVELWLPERVDMYVIYRGHAYHNYSHFSRFELFWAGSKQEIAKPAAGSRPK